jgi:hypothetical protein
MNMTKLPVPSLVATRDQAVLQIEQFMKALAALNTLPTPVREDMLQLVTHAQVWVARLVDGQWRVGPAKFVGHDGTPGQYHEHRDTKMSGTRAVQVLKRWAHTVEPNHDAYQAVFALCASLKVMPNKRFTVLLLDSMEVETQAAAQPSPADKEKLIADLICAVIPTLSPHHRARVMQAATI